MKLDMNTQQFEAVMDNSKHILVLAGAGTGKTFVMINRIKRLVDEGVKPESILALTFTNAAAFEMKERFANIQKSTNSKGIPPEFKTFHAFCYSLLVKDREIRRELGYINVPSIVDDATMQRVEREVKSQCNIKLSQKLIDNPSKLNSSQKIEYDMYIKAMKRKLMQECIITFNMLADNVCNLFINSSPLVAPYIQQYKYIFIDEFQDTDPLQWEFAQCFKDASIFIVGDALQAIYGFRNADSSIIKGLAYNKNWKCIKLFENYRSTEDIVAYANKMSSHADNRYRVELHAQKSGLPVEMDSMIREDRQEPFTKSVLERARQFCINHDGTSAILVRTNAEVREITSYLEDMDTPFSTGKQNNDAIHILKSAIDGEFMINWLASFLNADKYANFIRIEQIESKEGEKPIEKIKRFHKHFGNISQISKYIEDIFLIRRILTGDDLPFMKCNQILDLLDIKDIIVDTNAIKPVEILEYLISAVRDKKSNDLYVGTIHSSKGLEYDSVVLLGVDGPSFPLDSEENKNLYYVGITRSRTNLMVSIG